ATAVYTLGIEDDGPSITPDESSVGSSVTLDETDRGPTTDGVFASALSATSAAAILSFTSDYGADGAGTTTYGLTVTDAVSGLATAQGDHAITLVQTDATTITGVYNDGTDHTAFTVVINADGTLTVTQYVALEHTSDGDNVTPAGSYDDSLDLSGKISASATVTDADGDTAQTSADVGGAVSFKDDGPSAGTNANIVMVDDDDEANGIGDNASGDDVPAFTTGTLSHIY